MPPGHGHICRCHRRSSTHTILPQGTVPRAASSPPESHSHLSSSCAGTDPAPSPGLGRGLAPAASAAATGRPGSEASRLRHHQASASRWHFNPPPSKCFKFRGGFELAPKEPAHHHLYSSLSFFLFSSPRICRPERSPATRAASAAKYSPDV